VKELTQLRKVRSQVSDRIAQRSTARTAAERVVDAGGDPADLVSLTGLIEADELTRGKLDRRIGELEVEVERNRRIARLAELDPIVEEARRQVTAARLEANEAVDTVITRLAATESALFAAERAFLELAGTLAPIQSHRMEDRPANEALIAELRGRGATLQAIGMTRHGQHAFTIAGGGDGPWPGPWGWLLEQAVNGYFRKQAADAHRSAQEASALAGASA
jgi:hypothetical protein